MNNYQEEEEYNYEENDIWIGSYLDNPDEQTPYVRQSFDKYVCDMRDAKFDLTPEVMAKLDYKVLSPAQAGDKTIHWVVLNEDNLKQCY